MGLVSPARTGDRVRSVHCLVGSAWGALRRAFRKSRRMPAQHRRLTAAPHVSHPPRKPIGFPILDTSVIISWRCKDPATLNRIVNYKARKLSFSAIALTEILGTVNHGVGRPANREQVCVAAAKFPVVNFDSKAAACAAVLRRIAPEMSTLRGGRREQPVTNGPAGLLVRHAGKVSPICNAATALKRTGLNAAFQLNDRTRFWSSSSW